MILCRQNDVFSSLITMMVMIAAESMQKVVSRQA